APRAGRSATSSPSTASIASRATPFERAPAPSAIRPAVSAGRVAGDPPLPPPPSFSAEGPPLRGAAARGPDSLAGAAARRLRSELAAWAGLGGGRSAHAGVLGDRTPSPRGGRLHPGAPG